MRSSPKLLIIRLIYLIASVFTAAGFILPIATSRFGWYHKIPIMEPYIFPTILLMLSFVTITVSAFSVVKGNISIRFLKQLFLCIGVMGLFLFGITEYEYCQDINRDIQEIKKMSDSNLKTRDEQIDFIKRHNHTDALRDVIEAKKREERSAKKIIKYGEIGIGGILTALGYLWFIIGFFFVKTDNRD